MTLFDSLAAQIYGLFECFVILYYVIAGGYENEVFRVCATF